MYLETLTTDLALQTSLPRTGPIFDPQQWPFDVNLLPPATYLVGGSVRDGLLGRQADHLDLDFVMATHSVETARAIAAHYKAGFVLLDEERHIARVVFDNATADFAQQVGDSLEEDLWRRDFTVNAIAYEPHTGELFDPLKGYSDLKDQTLRMIAVANLKDDPLRLLRAYRQSAQLGFALDPETQRHIRRLAPLLKNIAPERVHAELAYLLSGKQGSSMLTQVWRDGLLQEWLPDATQTGLKRVHDIDHAISVLTSRCPEFIPIVSGWVNDQHQAAGAGRSWIKAAKLACLVSAHANVAEHQLWQLKCSRAEVQAVLTVLNWMAQVLESDRPLPTSQQEQFFFFRTVGPTFPALALAAVAVGQSVDTVVSLIQYFLDPVNPISHPNPILTGHDLTQILNLKPGPIIGQLLEKLCIAHAEGMISTPQEALEYVKTLELNL